MNIQFNENISIKTNKLLIISLSVIYGAKYYRKAYDNGERRKMNDIPWILICIRKSKSV